MIDWNMFRLTKKRRAQVTIFLIIGVILLFSSAILLYIRGRVAEAPAEFKPVVEEVPLELQPAKLYVEACVKQVTKNALRMIGLQGGYINVTDYMMSGKTFDVSLGTSSMPTDYDAIAMFEESATYMPYWWHMDSPNDCSGTCTFASGMPKLYKTYGANSIEAQVDTYVQKELKSCLGNYAPLTAQGFEVQEMGELTSDFRVGLKDVAVLVEYPLRITKAGRSTDIKNFFVRIDLNLKDIYELAEHITNAEIEFQFLEWQLLNLIPMYSQPMDNAKIPPIAAVTFGYDDFYMWSRTVTQQKLESYVLPQGMAMLYVIGARNYVHRNIFNEEGEPDLVSIGLLDNMNLALNTTRAYPDITANFMYMDWWPIYLNINDKEILMPTSLISDYIPIFNPKTYHFLYDVSFPAVVMLYDTKAIQEDEQGYRFFFALEGNLRDNKPMNTSYVGRNIGIDMSPMQCKPDQRNSGLINITLKDHYTGKPVDHARIDIKYGNNYCFIGFTSIDANGEAVLSTNFPVGNGVMNINKEGYAPFSQRFGALLDVPAEYDFDMMPERFMNARIRTKRMAFLPGTGGSYVMINPDQVDAEGSIVGKRMASIRLTRIDDDAYKGYQAVVVYDPEKGVNSSVRLIPGKYEAKGELLNEEGLTLEASDFTYEVPFGDDQTIHFNRTVITNWIEGGIILEDGYYIEIPADALLNDKTALFFVLQFPIPMLQDRMMGDAPDLKQPTKHKEYSALYADYLRPRFI
ncbi:MAG: hypothetical protein KJ574_01855 [Nanoarchaeota archaeon]|nr:hypothetical protein [Nanoarchaeota archaeon]